MENTARFQQKYTFKIILMVSMVTKMIQNLNQRKVQLITFLKMYGFYEGF